MNSVKNNPTFWGKEPVQLRFGTSGLRGLVVDMTDLECYINTKGFIEYLIEIGNIYTGDTICIAGDLRSSTRRIMTAVTTAIEHSGCKVDNCGLIPTPAVTYYAMQKGQASIMVTGSHIPDDRNGIKFNRKDGEVSKTDETGILAKVARVRREQYSEREEATPFDKKAMLKKPSPLPDVNQEASAAYVHRYLASFSPNYFSGKTIIVYQHSAVGRDMLVHVLEGLGAQTIRVNKSGRFVAIDTENITTQDREFCRDLADKYRQKDIFAIVSTDSDSDRPLIADEKGELYRGDVLGIVVCQYLNAQFAAVPISVNRSVGIHLEKNGVVLRYTKIGSPYVIEAMNEAIGQGKSSVVGWETNGGFLTGTDFLINGNIVKALSTRDAFLPILCALAQATKRNIPVSKLFSELPQWYTDTGLIDNFPQETGRKVIKHFLPPRESNIQQVDFEAGTIKVTDVADRTWILDSENPIYKALSGNKAKLERFFNSKTGFDSIVHINYVDGIRITFVNGDVAHLRPSGNAPQFRVYSNANSQERASEIVQLCISEPDGIVQQMERELS